MIAHPLVSGLEVSWTLRSPAAPERFRLRLALPAGARLVQRHRGGLVVMRRDGRDVAAVLPPAAVDTQGSAVETTMELIGRDVVQMSLPHRSKDLAYPILLDPPIHDSWYFGGGHRPFSDHWVYSEAAGAYSPAYSGSLGGGLYVQVPPGPYYAVGYGLFQWRDPFWNTRTTYSHQVSYFNVHFNTPAYYFQLIQYLWANDQGRAAAARVSYTPLSGANMTLAWPQGITQPPYGPESSDGIWFGVQALYDIYIGDFTRIGYVGNVVNFLTDPEAPTIQALEHVSRPEGWVEGGTYSARVGASDPGLGVYGAAVEAPGAPRSNVGAGCSGSPNYSPCPTNTTLQVDYSLDGWPEGHHRARAIVRDPVDHETPSSQTWDVKVDRTAPELELSGPLYDRRGQELPTGSYELTATATDGDGSSTDLADHRSGVRDLDVYVDGELVESKSQPCLQGSCPLTLDWSFDTAEQTGGEHTVEVRATDHLDHESVQQFEVSTPCCLAAATSWGTIFGPLDDVVFGDADGDGFADAVTRKTLTGQLTVSRSTGSSFATAESWGSWSAPAADAELQMADVNGDVREDLVARDPADGKVYVALSTGSSFAPPTDWGTWPGGSDIFVEDANGDGSADIVGRNESTGQFEVAGSLYFDQGGEERFEAPTVWSEPQPGPQLALGDVDFDGTADLVSRTLYESLQVALSSTIDFEAHTSWGSLPSGQLRVGDVNADGTADAVDRDPTNGDVRFAISDGEAFAAPDLVGTFDPDYPVELADVDGDGDTDLIGRDELTGDIQVALSNAAPAPREPAPDWTPDPEIDYDDANLFPEVGGFGIQQAPAEPTRMQMGFEDPARLLERRNLVPDPFGAGEAQANERLDLIYKRIRATGARIVRFNVRWGLHENADGSFYFEKLDKAINRAKANGMRVYLTLTGYRRDFECSGDPARDYNVNARVCMDNESHYACGALSDNEQDQTAGTGLAPNPDCFAVFARATVAHVGDRVGTYSIWNEPNERAWLQAGRNQGRVVPADLYRSLYQKGREAIMAERPDAKVMIGEVSSRRQAPAGFESGSVDRGGVNAHQFLRRVVAGASEGLVTDGVAWHPYQHAQNATHEGVRGLRGIGRVNETQELLDDLYDKGQACSSKRLRTPGPDCRRPGLLYTEFGYLNRGVDRPRQEFHTEHRRYRLFKLALRRALRNRVKWMSVYHATEIPPGEVPEADDYGLFAANGTTNGTRGYGKSRSNRSIDNDNVRRAYCQGIFEFTASLRTEYTVSRPDSACDAPG